nr:hypothetical protein [Tanacetum cinerariifolium]
MSKNVTNYGMFSSVQQRINHKDFQNCLFACFLSQVEPKKVIHALTDPSWIEAMRDELLQFKLQQVWTLVGYHMAKGPLEQNRSTETRKNNRGIVIRNKARLVVQGYTQEKGIDYDGVFAPVARIEAIRLFLAYASFKDFVVYQMDVKSKFLHDKIEVEVYVYQPSGFKDQEFLDRVYKVEKALYGLHQAPRAWCETLSTYLLDNGFHRGQIDKTLFIKMVKDDILLVQVYVDDIIFGSTKKEMCTEFEKMIHKKFQISSMGELTFFLGLQMTYKEDRIFISQHKSMIGSLMYLTSSRPDIMFAACARFQVTHKVSHLHAVKRIFRFLKEDADFAKIVNFLNANPIRQRKDFSGRVTSLFETMLIQHLAEVGEGSGQPTKPQHTPTTTSPSHIKPILTVASSQPKKTKKHRKSKRKATEISQSSRPTTFVADETIHEKRETEFERLSKQSHEPPLSRVNTLGSREDNMQLMELMDLCTQLSNRVIDLENEDASNQERNDQDEEILFVQEDAVTQGRYGHDIEVNTASTSITTASINLTANEPITTVSALVTTAGYELAQRLQAEEQGELTLKERLKLFVELIDKRKKHFAKLRAEEIKRKPPIKAQKRNQMCTCLKNMANYKHSIGSSGKEVVSMKRTKEKFDQESSKRQKTSETSELAKEPKDKEADELTQEELQQMMIIIIRVGNHTEVHHFFDDIMKAFDKDDLVMMWSLVKEKFNSTEPTDNKEREIWVELKRLFKPDTDEKGIDIYMLVEKEYPFLRGTFTLMLVAKILVEQDNEMSRELLRKIFMQTERPRR